MLQGYFLKEFGATAAVAVAIGRKFVPENIVCKQSLHIVSNITLAPAAAYMASQRFLLESGIVSTRNPTLPSPLLQR